MSPTTAGNPTRQQLDELDALLQRMLALPLNPAEEPAPPPPAGQPVNYRTPVPEPTAYRPPPAPAPGTNGWRSPALMFTADSMTMTPPPPAPPSPAPPPMSRPAPPPDADNAWTIDLNPKKGSSILGARSPAASPPAA